MGLHRLSQPDDEPISLVETKQHLRQEIDDDDALIRGLISAAREAAEHICGRSLVTSTWVYTFDCFPPHYGRSYGIGRPWVVADEITLPLPDVRSIGALEYRDSDGAQQTITGFQFDLNGYPATIAPANGTPWPAVRVGRNGVKITFDAGYGDPEDVPATIKAWMKLRVGDLYNNREGLVMFRGTIQEMPFLDRLLDPFRILDI